MRRLALLAVPLILAACEGPGHSRASSESTMDGQTVSSVEATDPWCRPTPNGQAMTACYVTLTASVDDRLTHVISPRAGVAQLHAVVIEGDVMTMREMPDGLALPAGQTVSLAPGGDHIMLMDVTVPLAEGDRVPLALTFQSGAQIALDAPVRTAPADAMAGHAGH